MIASLDYFSPVNEFFTSNEATTSMSVPAREIDDVLSDYVVAEASSVEVRDFLERHADLLDVVHEAPVLIRKHFPGASIELGFTYDTEDEDAEGQLLIYLRTRLDPLEAVRRLHEFDHEWWLDKIAAVGERLCIQLLFTD